LQFLREWKLSDRRLYEVFERRLLIWGKPKERNRRQIPHFKNMRFFAPSCIIKLWVTQVPEFVKPSRLRTSLIFPFSGLTLVEPSWGTSIGSLFLSHPHCWSRPAAVAIRVSPHTESATGYAISEPTGSNGHYGSDDITLICRLYKFFTLSDVSILLHQYEVCICFRKLFVYPVFTMKCRYLYTAVRKGICMCLLSLSGTLASLWSVHWHPSYVRLFV
jgi:hypothetical protein